MRNPNRLYDFYNKLQEVHITYFSDWRFGQLCGNFFGWLMSDKGIDLFYPEEDKMIEYIREYAEIYGSK